MGTTTPNPIRIGHAVRLACIALALASPAGAQAGSRALSLDEALSLSRPASEAVALARVAVTRARGDHYRARSELFPQLSGSVSYTRNIKSQFSSLFRTPAVDTTVPPPPTRCDAFTPDPTKPLDQRLAALESAVECTTIVNPFAGFGRLPFGRKNTYNLGLTASLTLFDGGRIFGQMQVSRASTRTAEIGVGSAEAQLVLDVVQSYYDAALSDRLLSIAEATLGQAETTYVQTKLRREVGTQPEFELLRARVARDNQRPVVIQRRTQRDLAYIRLRQLLNLPMEQAVELTTALADTALTKVPNLATVIATVPDTVLEHRAPVRQAAQALRAQEGLNRVSQAQRYPAISVTSNYARIGYPTSGLPSWNDFLTDWNVAVGVRLPIFTGGRIKGDRMAADAGVREARLRYQQTTELALLDTRSILAQLEAADAAWMASEGTAAQAERAYQIADIRFREGISTQTELLDARIALEQSQVNRAQAARDLQIARVRVALLADLPLSGVAGGATPTDAAAARGVTVPHQAQPQTTGGVSIP